MSQKHVDLLLRARASIASGRSTFICCSTFAADYQSGEWDEIAMGIEQDIKATAPQVITYESWLNYVHPNLFHNYEDRRIGRLQWIDALIEYWRDKP